MSASVHCYQIPDVLSRYFELNWTNILENLLYANVWARASGLSPFASPLVEALQNVRRSWYEREQQEILCSEWGVDEVSTTRQGESGAIHRENTDEESLGWEELAAILIRYIPASACCSPPHLSPPSICVCVVMNVTEQKIFTYIVRLWKGISRESPDPILWTSSGVHVWKRRSPMNASLIII